jgi:hypothetical protein
VHGVTTFAGADAAIVKRGRLAFRADDKSHWHQAYQQDHQDFHLLLSMWNEKRLTLASRKDAKKSRGPIRDKEDMPLSSPGASCRGHNLEKILRCKLELLIYL